MVGIAHGRHRAAHGSTHRHTARLTSGRRRRMNEGIDWRPTATLEALRRRAECLSQAREFFRARNVLEVETPALVNAPVSDVNLGSIRVDVPGVTRPLWLHTSPEYAMKRLLAAGAGDIYQICRVFRGAERGRQHNPEFTMIEWYRLGFFLDDLMNENAAPVRGLLGTAGASLPVEYVSYEEALRRHANLDPFGDIEPLRSAARTLGFDAT